MVTFKRCLKKGMCICLALLMLMSVLPADQFPVSAMEEDNQSALSDEDVFCGLIAHVHDDIECYGDSEGGLACGVDEHTHEAPCYIDPRIYELDEDTPEVTSYVEPQELPAAPKSDPPILSRDNSNSSGEADLEVVVSYINSDPNYRYLAGDEWTAERAVFEVQLDLSGLDMQDTLINPILTLNYNTADINNVQPIISVSDVSSVIRKAPQTNVYPAVTWTMIDLAGGTSISMEGNVYMPDRSTPIGYPLVLTATLTADNLATPVTSTVTIYWRLNLHINSVKRVVSPSNYSFSYTKNGGVYADYRGDGVYGGTSTVNPGYIDATGTYPVTYRFIDNYVSWNLENGNNDSFALCPAEFVYSSLYNHRQIQTNRIEIVDYLPPEATFDPLENPGWVYDSILHTATYSVTNATGSSGSNPGYPTTKYPSLTLRFPNAPLNEDIVNSFDRTFYIQNPHYDDPVSYTISNDFTITLTSDEVDTATMFNKTVIFPRFVITTGTGGDLPFCTRPNNRKSVEGDYWWSGWFYNSAFLTAYNDVVIEDNVLDNNMKFTKFFVCGPNNAENMLIEYHVAGTASNVWIPYDTLTASDLIYSGAGSNKWSSHWSSELSIDEQYYAVQGYGHAANGFIGGLSKIYQLPDGVDVDGLRLSVLGAVKLGEEN